MFYGKKIPLVRKFSNGWQDRKKNWFTQQKKVFSGPAQDPTCRVTALKLPQGGDRLSRKNIDDLTNFVGIYGAKGLAYIKVNDRTTGSAGLQSPILKFLPEAVIEQVLDRVDAEAGGRRQGFAEGR